MSLSLEIDPYCFVCGPENPEGLRIRFESAEGRARARFVPRPEHQGYVGMSHGGILAALLDEAMVYAAASLGKYVATAELTVRFARPVPTGTPVEILGEVTSRRRRLIECRAELRDDSGAVLAHATGKLFQNS